MMLPRVFRGGVRVSRPSYYPTPYDRKQAMKRRALTVAWVAVFAGLGVLMAWRM